MEYYLLLKLNKFSFFGKKKSMQKTKDNYGKKWIVGERFYRNHDLPANVGDFTYDLNDLLICHQQLHIMETNIGFVLVKIIKFIMLQRS